MGLLPCPSFQVFLIWTKQIIYWIFSSSFFFLDSSTSFSLPSSVSLYLWRSTYITYRRCWCRHRWRTREKKVSGARESRNRQVPSSLSRRNNTSHEYTSSIPPAFATATVVVVVVVRLFPLIHHHYWLLFLLLFYVLLLLYMSPCFTRQPIARDSLSLSVSISFLFR